MAISVSSDKFYIGTDERVTLQGLKDDQNEFINDATVTADLYDARSNKITATPIQFAYVPGSDGDYAGILPAFTLKDSSTYAVHIVATKDGRQMTLRIKRQAAFLDA